jgi:hypothetical protein
MERPSRTTIRRDGRALLDQVRSTTFDIISSAASFRRLISANAEKAASVIW